MLRPDQLRQEHLSHLPNPHDMPIGVQHPYCRITLCACVCLHLCRCTVYAHLFASYCTLSFNQAVFGSSHCILFWWLTIEHDNLSIWNTRNRDLHRFADNVKVISKASDGSPGSVMRQVVWFRRRWESCSMWKLNIVTRMDVMQAFQTCKFRVIRFWIWVAMGSKGLRIDMHAFGWRAVEMIGVTPNMKRTRSGRWYSDGNIHEASEGVRNKGNQSSEYVTCADRSLWVNLLFSALWSKSCWFLRCRISWSHDPCMYVMIYYVYCIV